MDLFVDVLADSVIDTLKLIPFLFVTYLAMEALEHFASNKVREAVERAGTAGPAVGALLGALPQCGFSAMAATLFSGRVVTAGTLVAVILSTSDEMIPVFVAHQEPASRMLSIIAIKVVLGIVAGLLLDVALRLLHRAGDGHAHIHELCERDHCHCNGDCDACEQQPELAYDYEHDEEHEHHHEGGSVLRSALKHTVQVTVFIFVITLVLDGALELVGEDALAAFLGSNPVLSVLGSALVGLIPNCAASVVIAQLYVEGALGAGAMMAGLLVSAGVGLLVLFRTNRGLRQNLIVLAGLWATGVFWGLIISAFGIVF